MKRIDEIVCRECFHEGHCKKWGKGIAENGYRFCDKINEIKRVLEEAIETKKRERYGIRFNEDEYDAGFRDCEQAIAKLFGEGK